MLLQKPRRIGGVPEAVAAVQAALLQCGTEL